MIEDQRDGDYEVSCDYCSEDTDMQAENWADLIAEIKAEGWKMRKVGEIWKHRCPECVIDDKPW